MYLHLTCPINFGPKESFHCCSNNYHTAYVYLRHWRAWREPIEQYLLYIVQCLTYLGKYNYSFNLILKIINFNLKASLSIVIFIRASFRMILWRNA
jgi:hypothetical protein